MNDRSDERTRLLAETLHGEWADGPAAAMARRAAVHARRRRTLRRAATAAAIAATVVAVFLFAQRPAAPLPATPGTVAKASYEIISDDELLTALHDQPLLVLPQENGAKKIVLLEN